MNIFLKNIFYRLTFFTFSLSLVSGYIQAAEEERLEKGTYELQVLHTNTFSAEEISNRITPLLEKGLSRKRALEIFAREHLGNFLSSNDYNMFDITSLAQKDLGKGFRVDYKGSGGYVDNLYIERVVDFKTLCQEKNKAQYKSYMDEYKQIRAAYTEIYYLEDNQEISPLSLSPEILKNRCSYGISWPTLTTPGGLKIKNDCVTAEISSFPLSWLPTFLRFKKIIDGRLEKSQYGQTLTIFRPDGTLTLYDVIKK